ncbi:MAG: NAD-dependent epimerase/dehydratase family protein [Caulobacteraceae bacterium]
MPLAALAGASGFLGRRLVRAFRGRGWQVRALVRRDADATALSAEGVDTLRGDLHDADSLARLQAGADAAINCAGLIKAHNLGAFLAVNRDGAARFAEASTARQVLVSSLAAREPQLSPYAASKRAGEEAALAVAGGRLAVIRPPVIYGPGDRETLQLFRFAARSSLAPVPGAAAARLAMAHVDDVAAAVVDLAERSSLAGTWAVGGERPAGYAWEEIARAAWDAVGRRPRIVRLPGWSLMAAGSISQLSTPFQRAAPIFTRGKAREMLHGAWAVAPQELAPGAPDARHTLESGFADTVRWYRAAGWL